MRRWLVVTLVVLTSLLVLYAAYAFYVSHDNGTKVNVTIHAGVHQSGAKAGKMYYHCTDISGAGASRDESDQCTVTVHKGDKVTFTVVSDDGPGRTHDFRLLGAPYFLYPAGIEMEIEEGRQSGTFVAYATGDYTFICELAGHEDAGMWGTLRVLD